MNWEFIFLLAWTAIWSTLMGIIPPAVLGWLMYEYGKKQGIKQYEMAKTEIRAYIKTDLVGDITAAVRDQINGLFGPVARAGTNEAKAAAAEYAQHNPGIASTLMAVAARGGARWLGKQLGVPKDVVDTISGGAPMLPPGIQAMRKQSQAVPISPYPPQI